MTPHFYSRYVPPHVAAQSAEDDNAERPTKKRKIDQNRKSFSVQNVDVETVGEPDNVTSNVNVNETKFDERCGDPTIAQNAVIEHAPEKDGKRKQKEEKKGKKKEKERKEKKNKGKTKKEQHQHNGLIPINDQREELHGGGTPVEKHTAILGKYAQATEAARNADSDEMLAQTDNTLGDELEANGQLQGLVPLPPPPPIEDTPQASLSSALPRWIREASITTSDDVTTFSHLSLSESTAQTLAQRGYKQALPIQSKVIPLLHGPLLYHGDLCISAATGSGKTLAYALPMVEALQDMHGHHLRGLVVVPTRELVAQVEETLKLCTYRTDLKIATALGSRSLQDEQSVLITKQLRYDPRGHKAAIEKEFNEDEELMSWDFDTIMQLEADDANMPDHVTDLRTNVDILVCTPGRLVEHIKSTRGFTLQHVQWLVVDEADRLLDESFQEWIDVIMPELERMPPMTPIEEQLQLSSPLLRRRDIRKVICSATMTRDVSKLGSLKLRRPKLIVLEASEKIENQESPELPTTLQEFAVPIKDASTKPLALLQILDTPFPVFQEERNPQNAENDGSALSSLDDRSDKEVSDGETSSSSSRSSSYRKSAALKPHSRPRAHGTLIFTRDNENALRLSRLLSLLRPTLSQKIATLTKSASSAKGAKVLRAFQARSYTILVASDRASRGLDIEGLAHVINYDVPPSIVSYVHRVGRTARAGKKGKATTMVEEHQARWFWNDVARGGGGLRRKGEVRRWNLDCSVNEVQRERYEDAVRRLGDEAKRIGRRSGKAEEKRYAEKGG